MALKKIELYRGFNIFVEEARPGMWGVAAIEVPASDSGLHPRPPQHGRLPGAHASKEAALEAARAHIDRVHQNRKKRTSSPGAGA
jgi:hypothetical protein